MRISLSRSLFDNRPVTREGTWAELIELLRQCPEVACTRDPASPDYCKSLAADSEAKCNHRGPDGKVGMWGPAIFDGQGKSLPHVVAMDLIVYDVDHVTREQLKAMDAAVQREGLACILYSTHSSDPEHNDYSVRLVFELAEPIQVQRTNGRFDSALRAFRAHWAALLSIPPDPATKDESRLYFRPTVPKGTRYLFGVTEGRRISIDALQAQPAPRAAGPMDFMADVPVDIGSEASPTRGDDGSRLSEVGGESPPASGPVLSLEELRKLALRSPDEEVKRAMRGEMIVPPGQHRREIALNLVASRLPFLWQDKDNLTARGSVSQACELVRHSLNLWAARQKPGGSWLDKFSDCCRRAFQRLEEEQAPARAAKAQSDEMKASYPGFAASKGAGISAEKYTPEELAGFYAKAGVDEKNFQERWVIRRMGANWVFVDGRYQAPVKDVDLQWSLKRDLWRSPIPMEVEGKGGQMVPLRWQEILDNYSAVARLNEGSLSARESWYDARTQTFYEALCPIRDLAPTCDPEVQEWLTLFGDPRVLDWVAAVSQLQHQCAAIYLRGPKGIGKTLFATGLSRLWRTGGPTLFGDSVGTDFNSSMADCPLIFADESLPKRPGIIDELRALIGQGTHSLNRKFMPTTSVKGAVRLIIAGNNEYLLNTSARLESDDVDAMAARVLFVDLEHNTKPRDFIDKLKQTKGKPYVDAWIDEDKMAKHALWLAETRPLDLNERFIVSGGKDFADRLNTQSGNVPAVFEFLARYLSAPAREAQPTKLLKVGQGRLLVSTDLLSDKNQFERFVPSHRVMSALAASQALKQVREKVETVDGKDFHVIKVQTFLEWVRSVQVGDFETIKARIEAP